MQITLTTSDRKSVQISCFGGFFRSVLRPETLLKALDEREIAPASVVEMALAGDNLEIDPCMQFRDFPGLETLSVRADTSVRVNSAHFAGSNVKRVVLKAKEIFFNDGVFWQADQLQTVVIQGTVLPVKPMGLSEYLFYNCEKLVRVEGCYRGECIMPSAFANCSSLIQPMDLRVKNLGLSTFAGCKSLKEIHLHNGLEQMGHSAFENCTALEDIYIPDTVCDLGINTFGGCTNLKSIHLPKTIRCIPADFLKGCAALKKCFLPDGVETIEAGAFEGCGSLQAPFMPKRLRKIGKRAFYGCSAFKKIYIPQTVSEIGEDAFGGCSGVTIKGQRGSAAQEYALQHHINFVEAGGV